MESSIIYVNRGSFFVGLFCDVFSVQILSSIRALGFLFCTSSCKHSHSILKFCLPIEIDIAWNATPFLTHRLYQKQMHKSNECYIEWVDKEKMKIMLKHKTGKRPKIILKSGCCDNWHSSGIWRLISKVFIFLLLALIYLSKFSGLWFIEFEQQIPMYDS